MNHLLQRFCRDIIGLVWLATGIFTSLALISYAPTDPSLNSIGTGITVQNYCGYFGSFLADLLYQVMGLSAWIMVVAPLRMAYRSFVGRNVKLNKLRFLWAGLLVLTCSSLIALYLPDSKYFSGQILSGGLLGQLLAKSLVKVFNFAGVAVILWTMAGILLVFYTERPVKELLSLPLDIAYWLNDHLRLSGLFCRLTALFSTIAERMQGLRLAPALLSIEGRTGLNPEGMPSKGRFFKIPQSQDIAEDEYPEGDAAYGDDQNDTEYEEEQLELPVIRSRSLFAIKKEEPPKENKKAKRRKVQLKKKVQRRIENWELPKISLLDDPPLQRQKVSDREIRQKSSLLVNKLEQFSVRGTVVGVSPGPAVTMFEFKPNVDVKISKITDLADDLSLALSSESVRIIAPIPGRDVVGIETSNSTRETVYLKDILADEQFWDEETHIPLALGRQADGSCRVVDLRKMPHMLVAGSTGSGKSVFTVSMITGLLFRHSPKTMRLILVDPKQVDLAAFNDIPHLLMPPIREPKKAISALRWAIKEMEKRYRSMSKFGARGLESFNEIVNDLTKQDFSEHEAFNEELETSHHPESYYYTAQPYIVIVVEEFGDLMAVDKQNVEQAVVRLAQMARACGIHLVLAMQSPRKDVVTGLIKTNIPGRASFKVASKMDSRIILDESGAERLLTRGDMLFLDPSLAKPARHHGPWLTEKEINRVSKFWGEQGEPEYDSLAMKALDGSGGGFELSGSSGVDGDDEEYDERYDEILAEVATMKEVSASLLQRKYRLGYPRAARLIEIFEAEGVVGPAQGSKPRKVLINELK